MFAKAKHTAGRWILFLAVLLILSFAAMPGFGKFSAVADHIAVTVRLSLVLVLSVLVLRDWVLGSKSGKDSILQRCRRWYYGD